MQNDKKPGLCNRVKGTSRCEKRKAAGYCTDEDLLACGKKNQVALLGLAAARVSGQTFAAGQIGA